jgi:small subunit ribosomal protein S21
LTWPVDPWYIFTLCRFLSAFAILSFAIVSRRGVWFLTQVQVRPNESLDSALKRFKKALQQTGVLKEAREHEHYEKPSDKKRKAAAAARRKRMKQEEKDRG